MKSQNNILDWAIELQSLAQAGLTYGNDIFDKERYQNIRDISADMIAKISYLPINKVKDLFCNEIGYQTPKIATRAAIFKNNMILLVQENDGKWSLPGGWCEVNLSPKENCIKEVKEESGYDISVDKLIAIHDLSKHSSKKYPYGICEIFFLCSSQGGYFEKNIETINCKYFKRSDLPELADDKGSKDQVLLCFAANDDKNWQTEFD